MYESGWNKLTQVGGPLMGKGFNIMLIECRHITLRMSGRRQSLSRLWYKTVRTALAVIDDFSLKYPSDQVFLTLYREVSVRYLRY